jgi:hypothetical protein
MSWYGWNRLGDERPWDQHFTIFTQPVNSGAAKRRTAICAISTRSG